MEGHEKTGHKYYLVFWSDLEGILEVPEKEEVNPLVLILSPPSYYSFQEATPSSFHSPSDCLPNSPYVCEILASPILTADGSDGLASMRDEKGITSPPFPPLSVPERT